VYQFFTSRFQSINQSISFNACAVYIYSIVLAVFSSYSASFIHAFWAYFNKYSRSTSTIGLTDESSVDFKYVGLPVSHAESSFFWLMSCRIPMTNRTV